MRTMVFSLALCGFGCCLSGLNAQGPFGAVQHAAPGSAAMELPLYATRQNVFAIPFTVDRRVAGPVEVHLYVSSDQGAKWRLYARQRPNTNQFSFRAPGDGEYWFASRTLNANGQSRPDGPLKPELRVVVDTVPPQMEFTARPGREGNVIASWRIADQNLVRSSMKLEYQEGVGQPWKPVTMKDPGAGAVRTSFQGETTWRPQAHSPTITIRAEVRDRAGNLAVVNRRLLLPARVPQNTNGLASQATARPADPFARQRQPSVGAVAWPSDNRRPPASSVGQHPALPASGPTAQRSATGQLASSRGPSASPGPAPTSYPPPSSPSPVPGTEDLLTGHGAGQFPTSGLPAAQAMAPDPVDRRPFASPASSAPAFRGGTSSVLPPGEQPQMTRATRFRLEYDIDSVGPAGVAEVQLWATADGGHTWRLWGTDDDMQSPFDVVADEEGVFGFHVVIVSRAGMSGRKPRSGDLADIWVGVDTTSPTGELTSATYGHGADAGKLHIHWKADDNYLGPRPVSLLFSESPDGPWTLIASALPNTGEFAWPADPQLPPSVHLRLEVRDEAGNLTTDETAEPIRIDGLAPKARIRGVQPIYDMDREAFRLPRRG